MTTALANIDKAKRLLSHATTLNEVLDIRDKAEAIRVYCKQAKESLAVQNRAAEIKLRAERRAGELLATMPKAANHKSSCTTMVQLGITRNQSSRWQREAAVPEDEFERYVSSCHDAERELTQSALLKLAKRLQAVTPTVSDVVADSSVHFGFDTLRRDYGCIYADPPWAYGNQGTRAATGNHYGTMSVGELCDMPIASVCSENCWLHLWTTNAFLFDARTVIEEWGFAYKSCFVWVKPQIGLGNYWRVSHEFLLTAVRGKPTWRDKTLRSWGEYPRTKHSAKPDEVRSMIENACSGPYLELFGRKQVDGWDVYGDQIDTSAKVWE